MECQINNPYPEIKFSFVIENCLDYALNGYPNEFN